ncbi:sodium:proton antiporter [Bacillus sp. A301a_S52]|nr:sodium:proton antiporter [Bacillus sp. A301a_S52]
MVLTPIIMLLFIGYIIFTIDKKKENFPVPAILTVVGIGLFFVPYFSQVEVTPNIIYHVLLPGLLFTSAYQFPIDAFKQHGGLISFLATIGIVITVLMLGAAIFALAGLFTSLSFIGALLIATMLTPTDPVSVTAILQQSSREPLVANVLEGESLINDGTSIVLFTVILSIFLENSALSFTQVLWEFAYVSFGGTAIGFLGGWLFSKAIHLTHERDYQVMLSIVVAYGTFNVAEYMGFSGVLATVSAGMMLSFEFGRLIKEEHFRDALDNFWRIVEVSVLSILFLLIGLVAADYLSFNYWVLGILIFTVSIGIRCFLIITTTQFFSSWRRKIGWKTATILSWSGIKGAVSVFMILSVKEAGSGTETDLIISLTFAALLLSLVIQSIGVYPLSKKLLR